MMAMSEDRHEDRPAQSKTPALWVPLGLIAVCFAANDLLAAQALSSQRPLAVLAMNMLMVGAVWGLSRLKPSMLKAAGLLLLLGIIGLAGFATSVTVVKVLVATNTLWGPWQWRTVFTFASNLLIGICAIWTFFAAWDGWEKRSDEPISPATRRTNKLFGLAGLVAMLGPLALIYGATAKNDPLGPFSNSPVSPGIAIFAITFWLLGMAVEWGWYFSADEHERRAADIASIVGRSLFTTVTPAWWVAARAGLVPQPNAMVLWVLVMVVSGIAWFWHRNR